MKYKKITKLGIVFALAISILTNSVGNLFAQQEEQIEEVTTENYESDINVKEEVTEEIKEEVGVPERERPLELEDLSIDKQEESSDQEEAAAMYTLSKSKFYDIHATIPGNDSAVPFFDIVKFTDEPLPVGVTAVDLSENEDGSVIGGIEGEGRERKLFITTNTPGVKIKFPRDSSYLFVRFFANRPGGSISGLERNSIDLSNVDTSGVENMERMFAGLETKHLDLSNFDTSKVWDMTGMFEGCNQFTELDLSSFDTKNVGHMAYMFAGCRSLTTLDLSTFDTSDVSTMLGMFQGCSSLETLDVSHFDMSRVLSTVSMFERCSSLKTLDLSTFQTSWVLYMDKMFKDCRSLTSLNLSNSFSTISVKGMTSMFEGCSSLEVLDLTNFDTRNVTNMFSMFKECSSLKTLDLSHFDTPKVVNMQWMFHSCSSLTSLNLTNLFKTPNVEYMTAMFYHCSSLTNLDLTNFNTENVKDMGAMFKKCNILTELDLKHFNTSKVTNMSEMFQNCSTLTELDLSNFNTSSVTNMESMFKDCSALNNLNVSNFNTEKVEKMTAMFQNCNSLTELDLSHFNTPQVTSMADMFNSCSSLTTIYAEEWDTSQVTSDTNMFLGCEQVVGKSEYAITTPFDPNRIGKEVATPNNGYFTVPNLEEWNAIVKYIDEDNQVLAMKGFLTTNRKPEITTEKLNEFMPSGYELVDENTSFTVTQDGQVFEVAVRKVQWTLELEYQTADGNVVKTEAIQVTQLNPVVTAQTITEKVPTGYELAEQVADWTATANGEKKVIQVREIEWAVNLEYQTADGTVVKTEAIQVTQLNPVVTAQMITEKVPTGYELVDAATDWTATSNGEKKIVQVREVEWTVSLEYQTADGTVVKEEQIQVAQLNPVVTAQTITDSIPTGYELVDPASDWTATTNGDKKVIQVREVEWTVNLEYQTADGTVVKTEAIQVTQLNPVVTAQMITEKVPTGYELVDPASDWTATSNGEKKIVQVREVEWTVSLEYQTADGTVVKEEQIQVTQLSPVVTAQTITEKVPVGYELVGAATDWTATTNGDKKVIQVREVEWTVNLEYQTADGTVVKTEAIQVTQLNPVITAQSITEKVPTGYELIDPATDWTATSNGEKKVIQVREVKWAVNLEYQTEDGTVVKEEQIQVTQLNPVVTAETITEKVPTGYELVDPASDWTPTVNGEKKVIQVREIEWTITIEFITENARGIVETVSFTIGNLNPVIEAQKIIEAIPAGYYAPSEIQDLRATKDGEVFQVTVEKIESREGIVHFVDQNGITVKTEVYKVTNQNPMIRTEELEKALPVGATLVKPLAELTVTKDKEEFIIEVIMPVDQEPNQPEIGGDDNTTTDAEQPEGSVEGVQTGDTTQAGLWTVIMGGSIGILAYLKRKKKNI